MPPELQPPPPAQKITQVISRRADPTIPVTHHRLCTGGVAEEAGVMVSKAALKAFQFVQSAGLEVHVRQVKPSQAAKEAEPATPAVKANLERASILVTIEGKTGKRLKAAVCFNVRGDSGTQQVVDAMLCSVTAQDLSTWTAQNK